MSRRLRHRPVEFLVPLGLFIVVATCGFVLGRVIDRAAEERFVHDLEQTGLVAGGELERFARQQAEAMDHIARSLIPSELALQFALEHGYEALPEGAEAPNAHDPVDYIEGFQSLGSEIAGQLTSELAVNWVGIDGHIKQVVPFARNQNAKGRNLFQHPEPSVRAAIAKATGAKRPSQARSEASALIDLYQGGRGFAVYRPVFDRTGSLTGVLNAAYLIEDLVAERIPSEHDGGHAVYALFDAQGALVFDHPQGNGDIPGRFSSDIPLEVFAEAMTLRIAPTPAWLAEGLVYEGPRIAVIGILFALVIASLSFTIERKRAQKEESDLRLGLALEGARLGVWDLDVPSGELHLNDRWQGMLGLRHAEGAFTLGFYRSLVHPDDLERVDEALAAHLEGRTESYRTEHRLRAMSGEWVWVLDTGRIVERDKDGRPLRVAGTQTDITDAHEAKEALGWSMQRYRSIFETSPVGMMEQNWSSIKEAFGRLQRRGVSDLFAYLAENPGAVRQLERMPRVIDANPAFLRMFEAADSRRFRRNLLHMLDERGRWSYVRGLADLYANGRTTEFDVPLTGLDGEQLLYSVRVTVAPGSEDDFASVFVSVVDNTRRLREEEQRRALEARDRQMQKDESLALLAGGVAHDFNNLLVPIIGSIELALGEAEGDGTIARNLRRAEQASLRAAELARQMLTYSGRGQVQNEVFDLVGLVDEMTHLFQSSLPGKVELSTDLEPGPLAIEGDPTQLRQLVMNLVINAADAANGEAGEVIVRVGRTAPSDADLQGGFLGEGLVGKPCAFLEVEDTGKGLDGETIKRMFEPFFSTKASGRGLGMSVVLGIVRGHGGGLSVASRLGMGTRIRVHLPHTDLPLQVNSPSMDPAADKATKDRLTPLSGRVLVADDEPQVQGFAKEALTRLGVEVVCAGNGEEALALWRAEPDGFDVVLLDATMPRLGGVEAMELIREESHRQPIVLASGYTEHEVATHAAERPFCWFLPKPFGLSELVAVVREALAARAADSNEASSSR